MEGRFGGQGISPCPSKAPDERFVDALESALSLPIQLTFEELERRYTTVRGKTDLDGWMRDEQGWTLAVDAEGIRDNLERAAKFSCYALVNRLVFLRSINEAVRGTAQQAECSQAH